MTKTDLIQELIAYLEKYKDVTDFWKLHPLHLHKGLCHLANFKFNVDIYNEDWIERMVGRDEYIGGRCISDDPKYGIALRIELLKQELEYDKATTNPEAH